jgi:hypothetical protein
MQLLKLSYLTIRATGLVFNKLCQRLRYEAVLAHRAPIIRPP